MLKQILSFGVRQLLRFRYKIRVVGLDQLKERKHLLFLPNHPAEIDPVILLSVLSSFDVRPLVVERFYYLKGARVFMRLVRALPIPSFEMCSNVWKQRIARMRLKEIQTGLKTGENFLLYPSGHLKHSGHEVVGSSSMAHEIVGHCPSAKVILVRTTGLWGSAFSRAITGDSPDFWQALTLGIRGLLQSGLFFLPKREVCVEFQAIERQELLGKDRLEFNHYLQRWYNQYPTEGGKRASFEPLRQVSYSFWKKVYPKVHPSKPHVRAVKKSMSLPNHLKNLIDEQLMKLSGKSSITEGMDLSLDLGLDSLDVASMLAFLEQHLEMDVSKTAVISDVRLVHDVYALASGKVQSKKEPRGPCIDKAWVLEKRPGRVAMPKAQSIEAAFLETSARMGKAFACSDAVVGKVTYKQLKMRCLAIAPLLRALPGKYVGVMLPASVAGYLVILALLLAKKIPVILNWTTGARAMDFARKQLKIQAVISSRQFLSKLSYLDIGSLEEVLYLLEDIVDKLTLRSKIEAWRDQFRTSKGILKKYALTKVQPDDTAVVLFTSGTEAFPKAVPLSQKNILSNQQAALSCVDMTSKDIMFGALPPFHSFGLSVTGLFPLLCGMKVVFSPDPTDTHRMLQDIRQWKPTIICLAPSFYKQLFRLATKEDLKGLRLFVSGAEKAPRELLEYVHNLNAMFLEGYGMTECAPIVTLCRPNAPPKGVGQPLPGVSLCIVDPKTRAILAPGEMGEVCVRGPNVFPGYIGRQSTSPFVMLSNVQWYSTGDIGCLDEEGNLMLSGRIKRFVKVGGEMISLPALETELSHYAVEKGLAEEKKINLSITSVERGGKLRLVLFTTFPFTKERANEALKEGGFGRIMKIYEVKQLEELPLTGLGKVDLGRLNALAEEIECRS